SNLQLQPESEQRNPRYSITGKYRPHLQYGK
ncbi:hypothetical protein TIFTF001_055113, partial [Ficus carica]